MFLFLSRDIENPKKGDLKIGNEKIELKGEGVRVFGEVRGKDFNKKTLENCTKFKLSPNKAKIPNKDVIAVELEKSQHLTHWRNELSKLSLEDQKAGCDIYYKLLSSL